MQEKNKSRYDKRIQKEFQKIKNDLDFISLPVNIAVAKVGYILLRAIMKGLAVLFVVLMLSTQTIDLAITKNSSDILDMFIVFFRLGSKESIGVSSYIYFQYFVFCLIQFLFLAWAFLEPIGGFWGIINFKKRIAGFTNLLEKGIKKEFFECDDKRISELMELLKTSSIYESEIKQLEGLQTLKRIETTDEIQELVAKKKQNPK